MDIDDIKEESVAGGNQPGTALTFENFTTYMGKEMQNVH